MNRLWLRAALVVVAASVATFAWLGLYSRYLADDYGTAVELRARGFVGMQVESYRAWSGRVASTFFSALLALGGPAVTPFVAAALLLLLCFAIERALASTKLAAEARWLLALTFVWAICDGAASVFQSLFWQTGAVTYTLPLVFLFATIAARRRLALVLAFLTSASSEIMAVVWSAATLVAAVLCASRSSRCGEEQRRLVLPHSTTWIGAAIGLAVVIAAPGNAVRRAHFPAPPPILEELRLTAERSVDYTIAFANRAGLQSACVFFVAALVAAEWNRKAVAATWLVAIAAVAIAHFIAIHTGLGLPPPRGLITTDAFVFAAIAMTGFASASVLKNRTLVAVIVALLVLVGPARSIVLNLALVPSARAFATRWDAMDAQLRAAPNAHVVVDVPITAGGIVWVTPWAAHPVNRTMARYYGVASIETRSATRTK